MKLNLIITLILLNCFALKAQNDLLIKKSVKDKMLKLKKEFDTDYASYNDHMSILKNAQNLSAQDDLNKVKQQAQEVEKKLIQTCNDRNSLARQYKDEANDSETDGWFPSKSCKDFSDKKASSSSKSSPVSEDEKLMFLVGYNFDFEKTNASNGYMGHLNIKFPVGERFKINAGLMKINYSSNSNRDEFRTDNRKLHPLGTSGGTADTKYISQYNKYALSVKTSSYGAYFQPMYRITRDLHVHGHFELLVSQAEFGAQASTIQSDTLDLPSLPEDVEKLKLQNTLNYDRRGKATFYAGYFGVGLTGDFVITKKDNYYLKYFIQGTTGLTNNQLNDSPKRFEANGNEFVDRDLSFNVNPEFNEKYFFIVSTYVNASYDGIRLYVGAEIRGVYQLAPIHIFYAGVNLDLYKIASVFKS